MVCRPALPLLLALGGAACPSPEPAVVTFEEGARRAPSAGQASPTAVDPLAQPSGAPAAATATRSGALGDVGSPPAAPAGVAVPPPPSAPALAPAEPASQPATVRESLADLEALAGEVRIVPAHDAQRRPVGMTLSNIPRGSLLARLGLRDGDTVHRVNGASVATLADAMAVAAELDDPSVREIRVALTRRGKAHEVVVDLDGPMP